MRERDYKEESISTAIDRTKAFKPEGMFAGGRESTVSS